MHVTRSTRIYYQPGDILEILESKVQGGQASTAFILLYTVTVFTLLLMRRIMGNFVILGTSLLTIRCILCNVPITVALDNPCNM